MRTVFGNMYEVAHVWAQEKQYEGRDHSGHFYFWENTIYSYGDHFPCGKIVTNLKGEKAYILNSDTYSNSTAKHQNATRAAIPGGSLIMSVPGCSVPDIAKDGKHYWGYYEAFNGLIHYLKQIVNFLDLQRRARVRDYSEAIYNIVKEMHKWIKFWDLDKTMVSGRYYDMSVKIRNISVIKLFASKKITSKLDKYMNDEEDERCPMYVDAFCTMYSDFYSDGVLNVTLSKIQDKIQHFVKEYNSDKIRQMRKEYAENITNKQLNIDKENLNKWHKGKSNYWEPNYNWFFKFAWHTALRVNKERQEVETSKGVHIGIDEAKRLWAIVKTFHNHAAFTHQLAEDRNGSKWAFNKYENDILTAGCHKIPFSEMKRVAKELNFE